MDILNKASEMKKALYPDESKDSSSDDSSGNTDSDSSSGDIDITKIMQMMDIIKMFGDSSSEGDETGDEDENPFAYFDDAVFTKDLKIIKTIIPFLDYSRQKKAALFIKFLEMKKVADYYENDEIKSTLLATSKKSKKHLIRALKPHVDESQRHLLEMLEKILELNEVMERVNLFNQMEL